MTALFSSLSKQEEFFQVFLPNIPPRFLSSLTTVGALGWNAVWLSAIRVVQRV